MRDTALFFVVLSSTARWQGRIYILEIKILMQLMITPITEMDVQMDGAQAEMEGPVRHALLD